jgi:hypothetical protein
MVKAQVATEAELLELLAQVVVVDQAEQKGTVPTGVAPAMH